MPKPGVDLFDLLSTEDLRQVDDICLRFELSWHEKPHLENFLSEGELRAFADPTESKKALFEELLRIEIEYRSKKNDRPEPSDYFDRFPDRIDTINAIFRGILEDSPFGTIVESPQKAHPDATPDFQNADRLRLQRPRPFEQLSLRIRRI